MKNKKPSGPADNITYRDMYHFNDNFYGSADLSDNPSINVDADINSTIKDNPYKSNVEVEKDELVLQPDLSALFKVKGKTHKQGGVDVMLKPNSFIFSNDPALAFNEKDHKLFEFKEGGSFSKKKNTPADVLKRNVDVKHYNTLTNNIQDVTKDDLAKKSSQLMLEKYIETLGNVAYLQEQKKEFPDGIPDFSMGTAPVYNADVKSNIMEQKQYGKYGGKIKAQLGMIMRPQWNGATNQINPNANAERGISGVPTLNNTPYTPNLPNFQVKCPCGTNPVTLECIPCGSVTETTTLAIPQVPPITGGGQGVKRADWQFTPWQKISQLYGLSKLAGAKRYMPYRSQIDPSYTSPSLVNPEQTLGDIRSQANQQIGDLSTLSPILRNAQASGAYGQFLDKVPGIRSQYDAQNAQITNQSRQYNNQVRNNAEQANKGLDQQYYQQQVTGRQNFDNMKNFLGDQYMNNLLGDVSTNQALSYNLLSQDNPAYSFDWKSGNFVRNKMDIRDVHGSPQGDYVGNLLQQIDFKSLTPAEKIQFIREIQRGKALQYLNPSYGQQRQGGQLNPYR